MLGSVRTHDDRQTPLGALAVGPIFLEHWKGLEEVTPHVGARDILAGRRTVALGLVELQVCSFQEVEYIFNP